MTSEGLKYSVEVEWTIWCTNSSTTVANVSLYAVQFSAVFVKLVEKSWVLLYSFI